MPFAHGKPRARHPGGCGAVPRARPGSARLPGPDRPSRRSHRQGRPVVPDHTALPAIATHRAATPFASACGTLRTLRTLSGGTRLSPLSTAPSSFLRHSQTKAPSLRRSYPASPLLRAYPPPCPARPVPRGRPVGACTPPPGLPVLPLLPSCAHAAVSTPAEPAGARVTRFPTAGSLPRTFGGSASASAFSRPAQRSLLVAACALAESP